MPIPERNKKSEDPSQFMSRCMGDETMKKEFPDQKQRTAICMSKAMNGLNHIEAADFALTYAKKGFKYRNPKTNEYFFYDRKGVYKKDGVTLVPDFEPED